MSVSGSQTLTTSGGCGGPYSWSIVSGGGSLSNAGGDSVTYNAPESNAYCAYNPTIRVVDACNQYGEIRIAVNTNGYDYGHAYYISEGMNRGPCDEAIYKKSYSCSGNLGGSWACDGCDCPCPNNNCSCTTKTCFCCDGGTRLCAVCDDCSEAAGTCCTPEGLRNRCEGGNRCGYFMGIRISCSGVTDTRTDQMKSLGCCPASLMDSGGGSSKTNATGDSCHSSTPSESTANFRSGNLFHSQEVGKLTLSYNSIDTHDGPVGKKWTHNYNQKLTALSDNKTIILQTEDGNVFFFHRIGSIYYSEAVTGDASQIVKNTNGTYTRTMKNGMVHQFDTTGRLTSIQDRNSRSSTLTYSGSDLTGITDFNGRTTTITNTSGRITGITDPMGRTYTIGYTGGFITTITDPLNNVWQFTYASEGRMLTKTDPAGRQITYTYDGSGKVLTATDPEGKSRGMSYAQPGTTTHTEKDGGIWTYKYDPTFTVKTEVTDPKGYTIKYTYDTRRNLIKKTEHDGSTTIYTYDANGNRLSVTDPLGKTTSYTYNALNLVTGITDPGNNVTRYGYDSNGNLTSTTDALNGVTQYQYDSRGNITAIISPLNKTTSMVYDSHNNLISVTDPQNSTTTMSYDDVGNLLTQTDALNNTTTFQYNSLNQLIQITDPKGYITQYTYDYNGNRLTATDANGNTTSYLYNYKNQLMKIIDALNNITHLSYSGAGCVSCGGAGVDKLVAVTDAKDHTTAFEYDTTGKLTKEIDPLGKITTYTHDGKGNLISRTSPDNKTITYTYDLNNRLTQKQHSDNSVTTFQYDHTGNMIYAGNQCITYNFVYDANNRITGVTDSNARTIQYQYDASGNRTTLITPEGKTVAYAYDANSRLTKISTDKDRYAFTYDLSGRRTKLTYPNRTTAGYSYDEASRLTNITHKGGVIIDSISYSHDNAGNRLTKTETGVETKESYNYSYDVIYRLTQALLARKHHKGTVEAMHQYTETYTYDAVGNRLTGPHTADSYVYDAGNELQSDQGHQYEYDKNGNLIKKIEQGKKDDKRRHNTRTTIYSYDDENRLIKVEIQKNHHVNEVTFAYDPLGRRISKTVHKQEIDDEDDDEDTGKGSKGSHLPCPRTTYYVYDDKNIIMEYNQKGEVTARYVHGLGIDEPLSIEKKHNTYYYHADGLGSIVALTDERGDLAWSYSYDSFGNMRQRSQPAIQPYTYTGREYDPETGLYYYRARYYDPKAGRFVTKDPIGFDSGDVNLYAYVENNPVNFVDPTGLAGCGPFGMSIPDKWGFSTCCDKHDDCYDKCEGRDKCDNDFCSCMANKCNSLPPNDREVCNAHASKYCSAVKKGGCVSYFPTCGKYR